MRPGGFVMLDVPNEKGLFFKAGNLYQKARGRRWCVNLAPTFSPFHVFGFSPRSLRKLLAKHGLEPKAVSYTHLAIFITSYLSTADLGVYSLAIQINGIAMQVPTLANTVLLPLLVTQQAESGKERSFGYFRNVLPGIVLMWGVASSAMGFVFYFAIPVIYGAPFSPAAVPVWILLSATVVWIPVAIGYSALANTISATYISLVAAIASSAVNVGANFILIPKYGMIGCAIATLIAFTASVVTFAILLKRSAKMPISWTFFAFIPSVVSVILLTLLDAPVWALIGCVAVSGIIAFVKRDSIKLLISFGLNFRRSA